jgi:hypothetical protein
VVTSVNMRKDCLQRQLTPAELAACVGKRRVPLTRDELGSVILPVSMLGEIAKVLNVPIHKVFQSAARTTQPNRG